jgi:hypothetical protein
LVPSNFYSINFIKCPITAKWIEIELNSVFDQETTTTILPIIIED